MIPFFHSREIVRAQTVENYLARNFSTPLVNTLEYHIIWLPIYLCTSFVLSNLLLR